MQLNRSCARPLIARKDLKSFHKLNCSVIDVAVVKLYCLSPRKPVMIVCCDNQLKFI